jgi:hypothetical protein
MEEASNTFVTLQNKVSAIHFDVYSLNISKFSRDLVEFSGTFLFQEASGVRRSYKLFRM